MKKFYLTTAIDYANDRPHLGHVLEKVQADAIARYRRLLGDEVFFLTGTDEHGLKNLRAARKAGLAPQSFVNRNAKLFLALKDQLNLSFDDFIRTTDKRRHHPAVERFWRRLKIGGWLEKRDYQALYCLGCEAFLTEKELKGGRCPIHGSRPEKVKEKNWFFKLSAFKKQLLTLIGKKKIEIIPFFRAKELLAILEDLKDVSFSRPVGKLPWGIPVPGDPSQTIYVWSDALVNYLSAIGYGWNEKKFQSWWPADLHVIGKDILRFHALVWPAMLLAAGLSLPKRILVHGFINLEGRKMSKSAGHFLGPGEILKQYPVDALRFYLLREVPTFEDGDFTWERFSAVYKNELADSLGNLVMRVLKLARRELGGVLTVAGEDPLKTAVAIETYQKHWQEFELSRALEEAMVLVRRLNQFVDAQKPWLLTSGQKNLAQVLYQASEGIRISALLLSPFLPQTASAIYQQLGLGPLEVEKVAFRQEARWGARSLPRTIGSLSPLFPPRL